VPELFATRSVRLRIALFTNPCELAVLEAIVAEWDQAVAFYTDLFLRCSRRASPLDRPGSAELGRVRHDPAAAHPHVAPDRGCTVLCPGCPTDSRRAAIQAPMGAVPSYLSDRQRWEAVDPTQRGKRRKAACPHPDLTAYGQPRGAADVGSARVPSGFPREVWGGSLPFR
jgi:hypothetical protein